MSTLLNQNSQDQRPIPALTVLMGVYNSEKTLSNAVESVLKQSFSDFEFIIVDDGSTDGSVRILEQYAQKDTRVRLIRIEKNGGLTKALNTGLQQARAPLLARMDADDLSLPTRFEVQVKAMTESPEWLACGTDIAVAQNEVVIKVQTKPNLPFSKALLKKNVFIHGSLMFRVNALRDLNGYDEYFGLTQDYDLLLRLAKKGPLGWVDQKLYQFNLSSGSLSSAKRSKQIHFAAVAKVRHVLGVTDAESVLKAFSGKLLYQWERFRIWIFVYRAGISFAFLKKLKRAD